MLRVIKQSRIYVRDVFITYKTNALPAEAFYSVTKYISKSFSVNKKCNQKHLKYRTTFQF